jgi:hypothetical protein
MGKLQSKLAKRKAKLKVLSAVKPSLGGQAKAVAYKKEALVQKLGRMSGLQAKQARIQLKLAKAEASWMKKVMGVRWFWMKRLQTVGMRLGKQEAIVDAARNSYEETKSHYANKYRLNKQIYAAEMKSIEVAMRELSARIATDIPVHKKVFSKQLAGTNFQYIMNMPGVKKDPAALRKWQNRFKRIQTEINGLSTTPQVVDFRTRFETLRKVMGQDTTAGGQFADAAFRPPVKKKAAVVKPAPRKRPAAKKKVAKKKTAKKKPAARKRPAPKKKPAARKKAVKKKPAKKKAAKKVAKRTAKKAATRKPVTRRGGGKKKSRKKGA